MYPYLYKTCLTHCKNLRGWQVQVWIGSQICGGYPCNSLLIHNIRSKSGAFPKSGILLNRNSGCGPVGFKWKLQWHSMKARMSLGLHQLELARLFHSGFHFSWLLAIASGLVVGSYSSETMTFVMIRLFLFFHLFTSCTPSHDPQSVSLSIAVQCLMVTTYCCTTPHL